MSVQLHGSTALVTGATGGIGQAIVRALHARGATVLASGRKREVLEELAREVDRVEPVVADLSDAAQVAALVFGRRVDVLVANAALPASGRLESFSAEEIDRALDVNLRAPMHLARALLPGMRERGSGHLVFISSLSGKMASAGASVYNATKFGLRGFGFALSEDLRGTGVGATTVFPGFIREAGMLADSGARLPRGVGTRTPDDVARGVIKGIEKGRAEVDVAPFSLAYGARLFGLAPGLTAAISRRLGSDPLAEAIAKGQGDKR
ncbi:MAG: SDR family NAD(P)-dependent oxidoreductase [Solirubrobacterales bacterium]